MTDYKLKVMVVVLAGIVASTVAKAQTPAALMYDAKAGPIAFGAGDLKTALTRMGLTVVDIAGIQAQVDADISPEVVTTNRPAKSP